MLWQEKYYLAGKNKVQLIGDKVMRRAFLEQYKNFAVLQEVRFPRFTADMVLIHTASGEINGIEFKSDRDSLNRLPMQLQEYTKWLPFVCVATTLMHRKNVLKILEDFPTVGLFVYIMEDENRGFVYEKDAYYNDVSGMSIDWIRPNHQLYQWVYLLEKAYK